MVSVLIIAILVAISTNVFSKQQRAAIAANVQEDTHSAVDTLSTFSDPEEWLTKTPMSNDNVLSVYTRGNNLQSGGVCIQVSHVYGEGDEYSYHYSSATGKFSEGNCPATVLTPRGCC